MGSIIKSTSLSCQMKATKADKSKGREDQWVHIYNVATMYIVPWHQRDQPRDVGGPYLYILGWIQTPPPQLVWPYPGHWIYVRNSADANLSCLIRMAAPQHRARGNYSPPHCVAATSVLDTVGLPVPTQVRICLPIY